MLQTETNDRAIDMAFDRKIILSDESEWNGSAGEESDTPSLWIWLDEGYTMTEVFPVFSNPENTLVIKTMIESHLSHDVIENTYEGYTYLTSIGVSGPKIKIQLRKGS